MRDKILKVIEKNNKSLNAMEIMNHIKDGYILLPQEQAIN